MTKNNKNDLDDRLSELEERGYRIDSDYQSCPTSLVRDIGQLLLDLIRALRALRAERSALGVPGGDKTSEAEHQEAVPETTSRTNAPTDRRESGGSRSAAPASAPKEPALFDFDALVTIDNAARNGDGRLDLRLGGVSIMGGFQDTLKPIAFTVRNALRPLLSRLLADARAKAIEECAKECMAYGHEVLCTYYSNSLDCGYYTAVDCARRIRAMAARDGDGGGVG